MREFILGILSIIFVIYLTEYFNNSEPISPNSFNDSSYDYYVDDEFKIYVDKFFRDLNNHGHYPVIPNDFSIKFSNLESHQDTSHAHGICLGYNNDSKVEIYINKKSWESFNKTQKYYIIYHELSHDILNFNDLDDSQSNYGEIMFPYISRYSNLKMDDFISGMKNLFESF